MEGDPQIMRTPPMGRKADRTEAASPRRALPGPPPSTPPTEVEAREIVKAIRPQFADYAGKYDTKKYWPIVYQRVRREFHHPTRITADTLRDALLWKYGHLGKTAIPPAHEQLIAQIQRDWRVVVTELPRRPEAAFLVLDQNFGGKTRFITIAFLLHLLYPRKVPIIDQHNFRAVNALMAGTRPAWHSKQKPSQFADIVLVAAFMKAIVAVWRRLDPISVPTERELDKFLMMYGKAIKARAKKRLQRAQT
jgi:hypothetical protein